MAQRTKGRELDGEVLRAAANQRSKLVAGLLEPDEYLAADPAVCVIERTAAVPSAAVEALVYATDRRLLVRAMHAETRATWPYCEITSHAVDRCTYRAFFRSFPLTTRLRVRRRYFATFTFTTSTKERCAAHGSRPFLTAIASAVSEADVVPYCPGCGRAIDWDQELCPRALRLS
jgi:hypothetical protein